MYYSNKRPPWPSQLCSTDRQLTLVCDSPHFLQQNHRWLSSCTERIFYTCNWGFIFCLPVFIVSEREEAIVFIYKSDTIMLAALLFGLIVYVPFIPHCSDWSSFDWNVLSSWKETTVFDLHLSVGGSTLGRAFIASSVGALVMCRKLIFTILWRNNLPYSITSGLSCLSTKMSFFACND